MAKVENIPIEKLRVGGYEVRQKTDSPELDNLCASIRRVGIIVPLVVAPAGDHFVIICGHRRYAAAVRIGLTSLPCNIRKDEEAIASEISIAENLFRKNLSPVEQACSIKDIIDQGIMNIENLAKAMHMSETWVRRQVSILRWPADVLEAIHNEKISVTAASNLALITDNNYRTFLVRNAVEHGATARTTAAWLQAWQAALPPTEALKVPPVAETTRHTAPLPEAACIVCAEVQRSDALAMVLVCTRCLNEIRAAVSNG